MRKVLSFLLACALMLSLAACGGSSNQNSDTGNSSAVKVDESLFNVDVTLAASFFDDMTEDEIKEKAKENGYLSCKINEDGSVTYTMTKKKHTEMLNQLKDNLDELISGYLNGDNKVSSFVDIQHNEDFSEVNIYVDSSQYTSWDSLYAMSFYIAGAYYQAYSGVSADDVDVVVNFVDDSTQEILNTASYKNFVNNSNSSSMNDEPVDAGSSISVAEQQTVSIPDTCEFYVDYTNITNDVVPPKANGWYSHYEAEKGKAYVDFCIAYKNLSSTDQSADDILHATLIYGGKYQYSGFSMIEEDNRSDFTYSNITSIAPLSTEYLHYLFEVPDEVQSSSGDLAIFFTLGGNSYTVAVREGTAGEVSAVNENAVAKTSGSVKKGDIIAIVNDCEFFVDSSSITHDVVPSNPGSWYSHYEADDGKAYVDFCIGYKNWHQKKVAADDVLSATLVYAGKYEYKGFSMIEEENRSDFTYSNITSIAPLCTEYLHYLFEVPDEVSTSSESVEIKFTIGGNEYSYKVR